MTAERIETITAGTSTIPKILVFSDFDGTITTRDTGTAVIDHCMGHENRRALDKRIMDGELGFRAAVDEMWSHVKLTWPEAVDIVKPIQLSPGLNDFLALLKQNDIPLFILSGGLTPLIHLFVEEGPGVEIFANEIDIPKYDGEERTEGWKCQWRDETIHGHDKAMSIRNTIARYTTSPENHPHVVFIGDGVSDINGARAADTVLARNGYDLEKYCDREGIKVTTFTDFGDVIRVIQALLDKN
ncbi:hypothetical protein HDU85_000984 [Gaertneriomyces sp. JEL0708]|nr:hypothetical protein HDU85_000984 [Gaertneriomyces sp. JEL0708]